MRSIVFTAGTLSAITAIVAAATVSADPIQIFGVDVYIIAPPDCAKGALARDVHGQAGPFEREAQLSDIVTELARRSREVGANTLYSIRIVSAAPFRGAEAVGIAATCPVTSRIVSDLLATVAGSPSADVFAIRPRQPVGPERTLKTSDLTQITSLGSNNLAKLKDIITRSEQARPEHVIVSSCPFIPDIGFRLGAEQNVWWLVSRGRGCDASVLIKADDDWRKARATPLAPEVVAEVDQFTKK